MKCWEVFECQREDCPAYKSEDLRCWLFSGTHCRNGIQGKFLEKMEICTDCKVFNANVNVVSMRETIDLVHEQLKEFRQIVQDREDSLRNALSELKRSNEDLQQFAYATSHDLQEPLRGIAGFTKLLEKRYKGKLDDQADEFVEYIIDDVKRMQVLIKALLDYSRVGTKGKTFKLTNGSVALEEAMYNLRMAIENSKTEITYDLLPIVMADSSQLSRLFQNLIGNVIKFKGSQIPKIHISAKQEGDEWVFSVRDKGIGIDPKNFERIFMVFQRLHTREEYEGTGIGLAVCKKIAERHGGRIWVESEIGKGSTFYSTMPVHQVAT